MTRNNFLRNAMMAIAISLVPKILQPVEPEIVEHEFMVRHFKVTFGGDGTAYWYDTETLQHYQQWEKEATGNLLKFYRQQNEKI